MLDPAPHEAGRRQRLAVVGTGIAGMLAARLLHAHHDLTVFEANDYVGGHTNTIPVEQGGVVYPVDTGFIVYNPENYPSFVRLLEQLGVASQPTDMSFSVKSLRTGLEYGGADLRRLFAQPSNLLRPSFHRMLLDIRRFHREAPALLAGTEQGLTLGDYLARQGFSRAFVEDHLIPFGAAIWSAAPDDMLAFPARHFVQFFENHGFLRRRRPQWRVVRGGSATYARALVAPFRDRIHLSTPVRAVRRFPDRAEVELAGGAVQSFDGVILACHSDQALRLLADPRPPEREILGPMEYQENRVLLHTDDRVLPRRRAAWASWNYLIPARPASRVSITYNMNLLQGLDSPETFCVTLNGQEAVDERRVIRELVYHHPRYTVASVAAQARHGQINGVHRTYYCGAYWGYGFHEDGVRSALAVTRLFGQEL
ncbi:MAG: FAD-dependent oxidoreductase [Gemmatimonadota bacterium]